MPELKPYLAPKLTAAGFRHAFFGRVGGLSHGAYSSLNCSYSVGDDPDTVRQNLARISAYFGLTPDGLVTTSQVHGRAVLDFDSIGNRDAAAATAADAICTTQPHLAICVRTADCVPILVGCRTTGTVAAIHAGWRGLVAGIVPAAIEHLFRQGSVPDSLLVAIGPHIGSSAFEVSAEVAGALSSAGGGAAVIVDRPGCKPHVRLAGVVVAQLEALGLRAEQLEDLDLCTFSRKDEFFSYRRDGQKSGRELSVILARS
ncbi:MAG: peptidoglycan editing factor PgeF [Myxococcales bacterium]